MDAGSIALMIPIAAILSGAVVKIYKLRLNSGVDGPSNDILSRLDAMEQEQAALRQELPEAQERLDFTERLLANHSDRRLPPQP